MVLTGRALGREKRQGCSPPVSRSMWLCFTQASFRGPCCQTREAPLFSLPSPGEGAGAELSMSFHSSSALLSPGSALRKHIPDLSSAIYVLSRDSSQLLIDYFPNHYPLFVLHASSLKRFWPEFLQDLLPVELKDILLTPDYWRTNHFKMGLNWLISWIVCFFPSTSFMTFFGVKKSSPPPINFYFAAAPLGNFQILRT